MITIKDRIRCLIWTIFRNAPQAVGNFIITTEDNKETAKVLFSEEILFYHKLLTKHWNHVLFEWHINERPYDDQLSGRKYTVGWTLTCSVVKTKTKGGRKCARCLRG
jgi:hypothetical protein